MPPLSRDPEVYEGGQPAGDEFWILAAWEVHGERENDAGEKETPFVRQREISGARAEEG